MRNLINGGFPGEIYPINPKADEILGPQGVHEHHRRAGRRGRRGLRHPGQVRRRRRWRRCGAKGVAGAILIPSGFAETGEQRAPGRDRRDRRASTACGMLGPNIYGYYYTPENLCATFCTPYDVKGGVALTSQSGGIGMAILGFSRTSQDGRVGDRRGRQQGRHRRGRPADLLRAGRQHQAASPCTWRTSRTAGRSSRRRARVVQEEAGRRAQGRPHRHGRAGRRARTPARWPATTRCTTTSCGRPAWSGRPGLNEMLEYARGAAGAAHAQGRERRHHHRRGRLRRAAVGRLRGQRAVADGRSRRTWTRRSAKFIPPFGAAGNPVDITGGEPPSTYGTRSGSAWRTSASTR